MGDVFSKEKRSWIMGQVRGRNTKPELAVRSAVHSMGFRFRLDGRGLPGRPDIVLPRHKKVIFVHGCFWHGHKGCPRSARPASNQAFWNKKLDSNVCRDRKNMRQLRQTGWTALVVWQCETRDIPRLRRKLTRFLRVNEVMAQGNASIEP